MTWGTLSISGWSLSKFYSDLLGSESTTPSSFKRVGATSTALDSEKRFFSDPIPKAPQVRPKNSPLWQASTKTTQPTRVAQATSPGKKAKPPCFSRKIEGPHGNYTLILEMPKTLFSDDERRVIADTIEWLNSFTDVPIKLFRWDQNYSRGTYMVIDHSIFLGQKPRSKKIDFLNDTLSMVANLMGRGIYFEKFDSDPDWLLIFDLSLERQNFEILEDSKYLKISPQLVNSHLYSIASSYLYSPDFFGSAVHAYTLYADKFSDFIRDPAISASKKEWGILVWCFLRERVFKDKVFTSNGEDPFKDEDLAKLLNRLSPGRIKALQVGLTDPNRHVRTLSAEGLGRMRAAAKPAVPDLIIALKDKEHMVRSEAIEALGKIGLEAAIPHLTDLIKKSKDPSERYYAVEALGKMGPKAIPGLILGLKEKDPNTGPLIREMAIFSLQKMGSEAKVAMPDLIKFYKKEKDPKIKEAAIRLFSAIGPEGVPGILLGLEDRNDQVSRTASTVLNNLDPKAVPQLIAGLKNRNPKIRTVVAERLGKMGQAAMAAIPVLERVSKRDPEEMVRYAAYDALLLIRNAIRDTP